MPKAKPEPPLTVRCPHCHAVGEPHYNEYTKQFTCTLCTSPVDAQVFIEKKKRAQR
jgi:hypothetical protein